jgi:biopolymer transport protein ExbD
MAVRINKGSAMQQLPVVPLVDTVLNLLIFFLVATRFAAADRELQLPSASAAKPLTTKVPPIAVNIDADGRYLLRGKPVTLTELDTVLNTARVDNPVAVSVLIGADQRCRWQHVVAVMDACNKAKIRDYHISTKAEDGWPKRDGADPKNSLRLSN